MPRITTIDPQLARAGIDDMVRMYRKNNPSQYKHMVQIEPNKEQFVRLKTLSDFAPADDVNEATGMIFDDLQTPFTMDVYKVKKGLGFGISSEMWDRDRYKVFRDPGYLMGRAIEKAKEADIANLMNLATTGSLLTPDQVAIASANHLLDGGTWSNILSGNTPLSAPGLEQACNEIAQQPSYTGDPMRYTGPFDLWVHPSLRGLANRLCKTKNGRLPEGNHNDDNWGGDQIRNIFTGFYFTVPTAWGLVVCDKQDFPFKMYNERTLKVRNQYDLGKDVELYGATAIWAKAARSPYGFIYSAGQ